MTRWNWMAGEPDHEHPDEFTLARLADQFVEDGQLTSAHDETMRCARCAATIAEFVRTRLEFDRSSYGPEVERWAYAVLTPPRHRPFSRPKIRAAWTVGSAAMLAAVLFWPAPQAELDAGQVAQARREYFALPGLEIEYGRDPGPVMRGGGYDISARLRASVDSLYRAHGPNPTRSVRPLLVARHLALSELQDADPLLLWMQQDDPEDHDYLVLRAVSLYQRDETELAVSFLKKVLDRTPDDVTAAYDLGKILVAENDPEGRKVLERLRKRHKSHALSNAATRILLPGKTEDEH